MMGMEGNMSAVIVGWEVVLTRIFYIFPLYCTVGFFFLHVFYLEYLMLVIKTVESRVVFVF